MIPDGTEIRSRFAREKRRERRRRPLTFLTGQEILERQRQHPPAVRGFALEDELRTSHVLLPDAWAEHRILFAVAPAYHVRFLCQMDTALPGVPVDVSLGEWEEEARRPGTPAFSMTLNDVDMALLLAASPTAVDPARAYDTLITVLLQLLGPDADEAFHCHGEAPGDEE